MADISRSPAAPVLQRLWPVSRFLGYRPKSYGQRNQQKEAFKYGKLVYVAHSLFGAFIAIAIIETTSRNAHFYSRSVPIIVGSFGAEAVLLYGSWWVPLAQPWPVLFGNMISAIVGVGIAKLFRLSADWRNEGVLGDTWACGALAMSVALAVMQLTGAMHPPGGATALLAAVLKNATDLGWYYLPVIAVGSTLSLAWALIINNVGGRRYPINWFAPAELWKKPESPFATLEDALDNLDDALNGVFDSHDKVAGSSITPERLDLVQQKLAGLRARLSTRTPSMSPYRDEERSRLLSRGRALIRGIASPAQVHTRSQSQTRE